MAENAKIAALRANSSAAPQGASGPQQLVYEWMSRRGSDLVMPTRPPPAPPGGPKSRRPPDPAPPSGPPRGLPLPGKRVPPPDAPDVRVPGGRVPAYATPDYQGGEPVADRSPRLSVADARAFGDYSSFRPDVQAYEPQAEQRNASPQPAYFEPQQFSYVPETQAPQEQFSAAVEPESFAIEPTYFDPGQFSYVPESPAPQEQFSPAVEAGSVAIEPTFDFNPADFNFLGNIAAPASEAMPAAVAPAQEPTVEPVMIDPAMLEMMQDEYVAPRRARGRRPAYEP